jgi:CubicO group peptidase (beta-lactamase class C family)
MLMVPRGSYSRAEAVRRLRFIKPATSFRSAYAYDNVLYMVAGQLIEAVSGQTWENYVREHVLVPAGMTTSTSDSDRRFATANRAYPHARPGRVRGTGPLQLLDERDELGRAAAPAGGLSISANDMTNGSRCSSRTASCRTADNCSARLRTRRCGSRKCCNRSGRCPSR